MYWLLTYINKSVPVSLYLCVNQQKLLKTTDMQVRFFKLRFGGNAPIQSLFAVSSQKASLPVLYRHGSFSPSIQCFLVPFSCFGFSHSDLYLPFCGRSYPFVIHCSIVCRHKNRTNSSYRRFSMESRKQGIRIK